MSSEERYDIDESRYEGYTPGPWVSNRVSVTTAESNPEKRKHIVFRPSDYHGTPADLRLIADIPNLLAAYQAQAKLVAELEAENKRLTTIMRQLTGISGDKLSQEAIDYGMQLAREKGLMKGGHDGG